MNILVVEDDPFTLKITSFVLQEAGYKSMHASNTNTALQAIDTCSPDLVLLDVSLSEENGFDICRAIRSRSDVPVIFVTAHSEVKERVYGLQIGGDDYLTKPYEPSELLARIGAVLRRRNTDILTPIARLVQNGLTLDPIRQELHLKDEKVVNLTPIEFRLMYYLMQNAGRILSTDQILGKVWGYDDSSGRNLVAVYIRRLRSKIEPLVENPYYIKTVANLGYKFNLGT